MQGLVAAVVTMSVAQLFDLATFITMVRQVGPAAEANPLVGLLFDAYGYPMVAIVKVALLALVSAVVAILANRSNRLRLAAGVVAIGIVIGIVGGATNTAAIGLL